MPDGTATVAMRVSFSYLPNTDGKYRIVFDEEPTISRWRKDGGRWRIFFFTSDKGWAIDQLKATSMAGADFQQLTIFLLEHHPMVSIAS
jgi:hypothetical protein